MVQTANVKVKGMTCPNCVKHVSEALCSLNSVTDVNVSLDGGGKTSFKYDDSVVNMDTIKAKVSEAGYTLKTGLFS